jgi:hypothetical protein
MERLQDSVIIFTARAEQTVVNHNHKIFATFIGILSPDTLHPQAQQHLRTVANKFIPDTEWTFSNLTMSQHESGLEQISVVGTTRVDETKIARLEQRAQQASATKLDGITLAIKEPSIDPSFQLSLIDKVESELRVEIAKKAAVECAILSKVMDTKYEVARIEYERQANAGVQNSRMSASSYSASAGSSYGKGFTEDSDEIGNAKKFSLSATITLAAKTTN